MTLHRAVAILCFAATTAAAAPIYRITVIPTGNVSSVPGPRINDAGVVAGSAHHPADPWRATARAFRWTESEGLTFSAGIDANSSMRTINLDDAGRIGAEWRKPGWPDRIATWSAEGVTARLAKGRLFAGNGRGDLVGYELDGISAPRFLWTAEGNKIPVTIPPGAEVVAMNNRRQMVGRYDDPDRPQQEQIAAAWDLKGRLLRIGLLTGQEEGFAIAEDINDAGEVAGTGLNGVDGLRSFYWSKATGMRTLPIPGPQCVHYRAHAINAAGAIVGGGDECSDQASSAWIWTAKGGAHWLIDLVDRNDPLRDKVHLYDGFDINARGQVVVWGTVEGAYATIVLTPVASGSEAIIRHMRP